MIQVGDIVETIETGTLCVFVERVKFSSIEVGDICIVLETYELLKVVVCEVLTCHGKWAIRENRLKAFV